MILTAITVIAGLLLGLVYEVTKSPIEKAENQALQDAYKAVFADADHFDDYEDFDAEEAAEVVASCGYPDNTIDSAVVAKDSSGEKLGYVLTITSHSGYGGDITFSVGIQNDGTLNGYSITSISETAGLGMKAKESTFSSQFENKKEDRYEVTKNESKSDSEIEAISGATITSKAMTYGINAGLAYFESIEEGGEQ